MKKVSIEIYVPARFKWLAQDGDGSWMAYTHQPRQHSHRAIWVAPDGDWEVLWEGNQQMTAPRWQETLQELT